MCMQSFLSFYSVLNLLTYCVTISTTHLLTDVRSQDVNVHLSAVIACAHPPPTSAQAPEALGPAVAFGPFSLLWLEPYCICWQLPSCFGLMSPDFLNYGLCQPPPKLQYCTACMHMPHQAAHPQTDMLFHVLAAVSAMNRSTQSLRSLPLFLLELCLSQASVLSLLVYSHTHLCLCPGPSNNPSYSFWLF